MGLEHELEIETCRNSDQSSQLPNSLEPDDQNQLINFNVDLCNSNMNAEMTVRFENNPNLSSFNLVLSKNNGKFILCQLILLVFYIKINEKIICTFR